MSDTTLKALEAGTGGTDLGAIAVMQDTTPVKVGKQTIVDQTGAEVPFAKDATVQAVTTSLGSDGATPPTIPGTGVRGWLRAMFDIMNVKGSGAGATAQRVQLSDESLAALESITVQGSALPTGAATETSVAGIRTDLGADGGAAPANGTGVRGWLRSISDRLAGTLAVTGDITKVNGAAHSATNPLFADVTDRAGRALGAVSGTVTANQGAAGAQAWPVSGPLTDAQLRAAAVPVSGPLTDVQLRASAIPFNLTQVAGAVHSLANPIFAALSVGGAANAASNPAFTVEPPVTAITTTGAAAAAATLTIPAPPAGQFIYLMGYEILLVNTAARATATATLITVTTTNLGTLSWSYGSPVTAVGSMDRTVAMSLPAPVKAAASGTACTIVAPATTGVQWMIKAFYYVAP